MKKHINSFILELSQQGRHSDNTIQSYERDLMQWLLFAKKLDIKSWMDFDKASTKLYLLELKNKTISVATMRRHLCALKLFFQYLIEVGVLKTNVAKLMTTPKLVKKLPKVINYEQVEHLIKRHNDELIEHRDTSILTLLYSAGLRLGELVGLNIEDIDFKNQHIKVLGKGSKERYTPIGENTAWRLTDYLLKRQDLKVPNDALFINNKNKRLSPRMVQTIVKNRAIKCGFGEHLHPHMLRHASATHFLQSSHDLRVVQEFLGHQSIKSTQCYTHLDYQELAKTFDNYHPRARKISQKIDK